MLLDEIYMERALEISKKGIGKVNPNPLVGAVIVKDGKIIGEGFHEYYGGSHAEINAFKDAKTSTEKATMYVTLEPCSHYGKTPPCVKAIIKNGIKKVIVGMVDPNPLIKGNGIKILRDNGIEVEVGVLENKIKKLNEVFIKYIKEKMPFCVLKTAMTLDGKIATTIGESKWITNEKSRRYVHEMRNKYSSIMVGVNTIIKDNPKLNVRIDDFKGIDPVKIVLDSKGRTPSSSNIFSKGSKTIIATTNKAKEEDIDRLKNIGADIIKVPLKEDKVDLRSLLKILGEKGIDSILIEGGGTLNYSCIKEKIVDKMCTFIAPKVFGGKDAKTPVEGEGIKLINEALEVRDLKVKRFDEDILIEGRIF